MAFRERLAQPFADADIEQAVELATAVESATEGVLRNAADAIRAVAAGESADVRTLLEFDADVLALDFAGGKAEARWGRPFSPTRMIDDLPFVVDDATDELESYAQRRAAASQRVDAAARWHDLRWVRWRRFDAVLPAIDSYLAYVASAGVEDIEAVMEAEGCLRRAADLALRLDQRRSEVCQTVRHNLERWAEADLSVPVLELSESAGGLLSVEPEAVASTAAVVMEWAEQHSNPQGSRQLLEAAANIARRSGATDFAREATRRRAASLEAAGTGQAGMVRLHWLREALDLYGQIGDSEALRRLRPLYEEGGRQAQSELHVVSTTMTIRREDIEREADRLTLGQRPSLQGYLALALEAGFWPSWDKVRDERRRQTGVLASLAGRLSLEADGRVQPEPDQADDPEAFEMARDIHHFGQRSSWSAGIFSTVLIELRNRGVWSAPLVASAIAIVDEDLGQACTPGLIAFEAGEDWNAAHALIPQIERALRVLGRVVGVDQARFAPDQGLRWASLDLMLDDLGLAGALGEPVVRGVSAIFSHPHGPNFRNNVAHGAMATDSNPSAAALLAILTILTVCFFTVLAIQRESKSA
jgi:hypothetical protein